MSVKSPCKGWCDTTTHTISQSPPIDLIRHVGNVLPALAMICRLEDREVHSRRLIRVILPCRKQRVARVCQLSGARIQNPGVGIRCRRDEKDIVVVNDRNGRFARAIFEGRGEHEGCRQEESLEGGSHGEEDSGLLEGAASHVLYNQTSGTDLDDLGMCHRYFIWILPSWAPQPPKPPQLPASNSPCSCTHYASP